MVENGRMDNRGLPKQVEAGLRISFLIAVRFAFICSKQSDTMKLCCIKARPRNPARAADRFVWVLASHLPDSIRGYCEVEMGSEAPFQG